MRAAVCTIIAKNYLAHARVLMDSVRRWNPELLRIVILADQVDGFFDPDQESFEIILSSELDIPRSKWFHFKYTVLELSTAVKPFALKLLFERYDLDKLIFLDPDIKLYASLGRVLDALDESSIILTPHTTDPLEDNSTPSDLDILRCGAYNLGFIGLKSGAETQRFLAWWQSKVYDLCVVDLSRGLFVDQRWMDLAPSLFAGVAILKEPGYNVAYWNLDSREIDRFEDSVIVNGSPLYFFHFSGFDPREPDALSRHPNEFRLTTLAPAVRYLVRVYRQELLAQGWEICRQWPYGYARFMNGFPIPDVTRPWYCVSEMASLVDDPFSEEGLRLFLHVCNQPILGDDPEALGISRLMYRIYQVRTDVQQLMPHILGSDRLRFLQWILDFGMTDESFDPALLKPAWEAVIAAQLQQGKETEPVSSLSALAPGDSLDQPGNLKLGRLEQAIYESRPELKRAFPDPSGRDKVRFLSWILTYGRKEHFLAEAQVVSLRSQWITAMASLDSSWERLLRRVFMARMSASVGVRTAAAAMLARIAWPEPPLSPSRREEIRQAQKLANGLGRRQVTPFDSELANSSITASIGINLLGYIRTETGFGEAARGVQRAAKAAGIPVALKDIQKSLAFRLEDYSAGEAGDELPYAVSLYHANADQTEQVFQSIDPTFISGKYNIGFWHWELEEFPKKWMGAFDKYQEIWAASTFCQECFARVSPIPVVRIPNAVDFKAPAGMGREYFGLPSDRFLFLALFDMFSIFDRKNSLGAVEAFVRAFGGDPSVELVIKINNAHNRPDYMTRLRENAAGYPVRIIDQIFKREEVYGLINACDCTVSLHRSEGFGLTLAEAMYVGKPVITTAYSGNMDFTKIDNSFLVSYRLQPVGKGNEPYDEDSLWADPCVEQAAQHMRTVVNDPQARKNAAAAGQQFVRRYLSLEAVGRQMAERLEAIRAGFGSRSLRRVEAHRLEGKRAVLTP